MIGLISNFYHFIIHTNFHCIFSLLVIWYLLIRTYNNLFHWPFALAAFFHHLVIEIMIKSAFACLTYEHSLIPFYLTFLLSIILHEQLHFSVNHFILSRMLFILSQQPISFYNLQNPQLFIYFHMTQPIKHHLMFHISSSIFQSLSSNPQPTS